MEEDNPSLFYKAEIGETSKKQARYNEQVLTYQENEIVAKLNKKKVTDEDAGGDMMDLKQDKENREIEKLRRQNAHLHKINNQLVKENTMLKKDLKEVNQNFVELIQVLEEAMKRRRLEQKVKYQLVKDKDELTVKLCCMQKDIKRLQEKSCVLDGLATLAEVARRI